MFHDIAVASIAAAVIALAAATACQAGGGHGGAHNGQNLQVEGGRSLAVASRPVAHVQGCYHSRVGRCAPPPRTENPGSGGVPPNRGPGNPALHPK